ncbi:MAG: type II secretion system F family protein [Pseudomonadota bacterium]
MLDDNMIEFAMMGMAAVSVIAIVFVMLYPYMSGERKTDKRIAGVTENRQRAVARKQEAEGHQNRRKAVAEKLKELENAQKKEKVSLRLRIQRAGLDITVPVFWGFSAILGVVCGVLVFVSFPGVTPLAAGAAAFAGTFGLPRWILARLTKRRQTKFVNEFANAIDVIVRGVKSGLPLNDCLAIIAKESPQPVAGEFQDLVDQQRVGVPLVEAFERMIKRMPLPEVKFFSIVIAIQQQAGGNLSEALGNLSNVLRSRKALAMKVAALSAEAKASAAVLGALPFIVMGMVYVSAPEYISLLWTKKMGQFLLFAAGCWMSIGIFSMKKMINFKY